METATVFVLTLAKRSPKPLELTKSYIASIGVDAGGHGIIVIDDMLKQAPVNPMGVYDDANLVLQATAERITLSTSEGGDDIVGVGTKIKLDVEKSSTGKLQVYVSQLP
jgi:hypothetical protein